MTFKLYENKSSVLKKNTRYVQGGDTEVFPKSLGWWEKRIDIPKNQPDDIPFPITLQYQYRPDTVAFLKYGRTDVDWIVLQYNDIVDINEQFIAGRVISLPSATRLFTSILDRNIKYQQQRG